MCDSTVLFRVSENNASIYCSVIGCRYNDTYKNITFHRYNTRQTTEIRRRKTEQRTTQHGSRAMDHGQGTMEDGRGTTDNGPRTTGLNKSVNIYPLLKYIVKIQNGV